MGVISQFHALCQMIPEEADYLYGELLLKRGSVEAGLVGADLRRPRAQGVGTGSEEGEMPGIGNDDALLHERSRIIGL